MDIKIVFEGQTTLEELQELHDKKGYDIILGNGMVESVEKDKT